MLALRTGVFTMFYQVSIITSWDMSLVTGLALEVRVPSLIYFAVHVDTLPQTLQLKVHVP